MRFRNRWFFSFAVMLLFTVAGAYHKYAPESATIVRHVPTTHKIVALTIDDGPHRRTTPKILDVLREKQVRATFFVLGSNVEAHPELVAQEVKEGHEIGNHSYSHAHLNKVSQAKYEAELDKTTAAIQKVAPRPVLFRPPGGAYNDRVVLAARQRGYTTILWSVDSGDWRRPPVEKLVKTVLDTVKPGGILLFHDGQYPLPTPEALVIIIDKLREAGYEFVTVSEMLQYYEVRH